MGTEVRVPFRDWNVTENIAREKKRGKKPLRCNRTASRRVWKERKTGLAIFVCDIEGAKGEKVDHRSSFPWKRADSLFSKWGTAVEREGREGGPLNLDRVQGKEDDPPNSLLPK